MREGERGLGKKRGREGEMKKGREREKGGDR